ncbi:uncharacterized protein LOC129577444 [Sitodiplosis mosellana]|uniref:uncharacterized protein LOC129577444 n=1 Tax=Sitodiplosis mosellana TaxID=263140 RepID=UPI0024451461|nr:uncharacterized protein LOC129577444 [Sitodiplosis mosellana]
MKNVHQCPKCRQIVLTEEVRAEHEIKHEEEQRKKEELKKKQEERDEDLVLNYVKTNKLDEYQPEPDYKPNIDYIIACGLNIEEISRFVKKFDVKNILASIVAYFDFDAFTCEEITYLLENGAVRVEDVAWFLDFFSLSSSNHKILSELVAYFLDKGYKIEREWVAKAIDDDALMERIKQKYTYTFDEIYGALEVNPLDNQLDRDEFYVQVHKHFPNPDFKDPFANPFIDFETILTEHVHDHLHNRYFYDEARDKLSIVVGYEPNRREISLGSCKEMLNMNLQDLIQQYNKATEGYDYTNDQLSKLFDKREQKLDYAKTKKEREDILEEYFYKIDKDALLERNYMANEVSKLYFVIAQK